MIKFLLFVLTCALYVPAFSHFCYFTPPQKWEIADPRHLAPHIQIGFIGKGKKGFHPSLNLATEPVSISLAEYVKKVKSIHESDRTKRWRDLGKFATAVGEGHLTEIESATEWGPTRLLQLLVVKEGRAYVLTGCAAKEEFGDYYKEFQTAFRSLNVCPHPLDSLPASPRKLKLASALEKYKQTAQEIEMLQKILIDEFEEMGVCWQVLTLKSLVNDK